MFDVYYHTLGISPGSSKAEIRNRYLELVRKFPPEKNPEKFVKIQEAYDNLKDPIGIMYEMLLSLQTSDSMEQIIEELIDELRDERLPTNMIINMGK
ncbi:MAG: DnaJ domain-containing protein [Planctomycetaceae bacterium]|jgi:preprotein translocase subunit Sec63|nr:DnaJ domain-containing protein [Planctomycetaceae bacterium]